MKTKIKQRSDPEYEKYRQSIVRHGFNTISHLQIHFGLGYQRAYRIHCRLKKDRTLKKDIALFRQERQTFIDDYCVKARALLSTQDPKYVHWDTVIADLHVEPIIKVLVLRQLQDEGYIDKRVYYRVLE